MLNISLLFLEKNVAPLKKPGVILHSYLPISATSLQWPLFPHGGRSGEVRLLFHQKSLNKSTIASKMASIMVAHAQGCDVILKKSGRLFQILMSYLGKITEQIAICSPANNSHNISIMGY